MPAIEPTLMIAPPRAFFHVRHRGLDRCHDRPDIEIEHRIHECIVHLEKRATRDE